MVSWHKPSCAGPDIAAKGDTLRCRSCHSATQVQDLIAQQENQLSSATIPQDEPAGQMDLWWPPSVPYSRELHAEQRATAELQSGITSEPRVKEEAGMEDTVHADMGELDSSGSLLHKDSGLSTSLPAAADEASIYGTTLAADEFRLLCLYAVDDASHPIHVTLEVFRYDDCPEYETVSYTWGGEDGDSTPCRPVFVGPYWDIALQMNNFWDMLRYLRPWRGIRMIWVDAICIYLDRSRIKQSVL